MSLVLGFSWPEVKTIWADVESVYILAVCRVWRVVPCLGLELPELNIGNRLYLSHRLMLLYLSII